MTRINPIYILIALNIVLILFRDVLLPEQTTAAIAAGVEATLVRLGPFGYGGIVAAHFNHPDESVLDGGVVC